MSSCVICLVIAREIFLFQSDCSAITKVYNFLLLSLLYSFVGHKTNVKNGGHFIQIGYFPTQTNLCSFSK